MKAENLINQDGHPHVRKLLDGVNQHEAKIRENPVNPRVAAVEVRNPPIEESPLNQDTPVIPGSQYFLETLPRSLD